MMNKFSPGIMTAGGPTDIDGAGSIIPSIARYLFPFRSLLLSMLVVSVLIVGVYNAVELVRGISDSPTQHSVPELCQWMPGDPTLYYLRTKLGVNYDAGHWFHMSENFMSAHSILRAKNSQGACVRARARVCGVGAGGESTNHIFYDLLTFPTAGWFPTHYPSLLHDSIFVQREIAAPYT